MQKNTPAGPDSSGITKPRLCWVPPPLVNEGTVVLPTSVLASISSSKQTEGLNSARVALWVWDGLRKGALVPWGHCKSLHPVACGCSGTVKL